MNDLISVAGYDQYIIVIIVSYYTAQAFLVWKAHGEKVCKFLSATVTTSMYGWTQIFEFIEKIFVFWFWFSDIFN